jgi:D-alanyl-D-alanine carboxypeptidase
MRQTAAVRTTTGGTLRLAAVGLVVVIAAVIGTFVDRSASSSAPSFGGVPRGDVPRATIDHRGAVTEDDGVLPEGVTVFDDAYPGVAKLDPDLLEALRDAATDAADDGVELYVSSGWRSRGYQQLLLRAAVSRYGSDKEAARWVATADTSPHVSGDAVDIGSAQAAAWLSEHGADYGLCQIYRNEPWHYEFRPEAVGRRCPRMYADPTRDPRLRQ